MPLGIVPAGSGNGLARELGIDVRPERALAAALAAEPRTIDVGEIEKHLFVSIAGIGVDAHVASRFNAPANRRRGFLGYAGITIRALTSYVPVQYRITSAGTVTNVRALLVTIANSAQFGNGARIAPGARLDDGLLDLVVIEERSRWQTLLQLPRLVEVAEDEVRPFLLAAQRVERLGHSQHQQPLADLQHPTPAAQRGSNLCPARAAQVQYSESTVLSFLPLRG